MEPIFKVGDMVRLVHRVGQPFDYKYGFSDALTAYSDNIFIITEVVKDKNCHLCKFPDDNAEYQLKTIERFHISSSMLELIGRYDSQCNNMTLSSCYKEGDKIVFTLPDRKYHYQVIKGGDSRDIWFLTSTSESYNDAIFDALRITNKVQFCKDVSECYDSPLTGSFPEIRCSDSTGISKIINKLMEMCEEKMKESLKTDTEKNLEDIVDLGGRIKICKGDIAKITSFQSTDEYTRDVIPNKKKTQYKLNFKN